MLGSTNEPHHWSKVLVARRQWKKKGSEVKKNWQNLIKRMQAKN